MPFLSLWTPYEARPPIPRARGACRPAASPHPERSTQRLRQLTPAELARCSCPLLQRNPSQSEYSLRCSSNLSVFLKSDCVRSNRTRCGPRGRIASRFAIDSSVELDQVLKDQLTPAISARLHKQSTFRKPAKFDRRATEIFRKRTNLRCCAVSHASAPGSDLRYASIDGEIHTGDVRTFIGGEERDSCRDFLGHASAAHWDLRGELCDCLLGLFSGEARRRSQGRGVDCSGTHTIYADLAVFQFQSPAASEVAHSRLTRGVSSKTWKPEDV